MLIWVELKQIAVMFDEKCRLTCDVGPLIYM